MCSPFSILSQVRNSFQGIRCGRVPYPKTISNGIYQACLAGFGETWFYSSSRSIVHQLRVSWWVQSNLPIFLLIAWKKIAERCKKILISSGRAGIFVIKPQCICKIVKSFHCQSGSCDRICCNITPYPAVIYKVLFSDSKMIKQPKQGHDFLFICLYSGTPWTLHSLKVSVSDNICNQNGGRRKEKKKTESV